jgi:hypothetical protein
MSDLKSVLDRGVGSFEPEPGGLERVAARRRRRQRNRRIGSAFIALIVAAGGISFAVVALQGETTREEAPTHPRPTPSKPANGTREIIELPPLTHQGIVTEWSRPNDRFGVSFVTLDGRVLATERSFTLATNEGDLPGSVLLEDHTKGFFAPGILYMLDVAKHELRRTNAHVPEPTSTNLPPPPGGVGRWGWAKQSPDGLEILGQWYEQVGECSMPVAMLDYTWGNLLPHPIAGGPLSKIGASYAMGWATGNKAVISSGGPCGGTATLEPGVYLFKGTHVWTRIRMPQGSYHYAMWGA